MSAPTVMTLIGTRPEIIKMSPLIPRFDEEFNHILVHSGQHYSANMDAVFFEDLSLRRPDHMLEVGSHSPGEQTARILQKVEELLLQARPDALVVHGDTNTTLAGALAAAKQPGVVLVHVEAGARSGNPKQAEEINRQIVDRVSDIHFVPYERDLQNLRNEGVPTTSAYVTGNTVLASCLRASKLDGAERFLQARGVQRGSYALATFHRQETVDERESLAAVCDALDETAEEVPVIAPLHPRTVKMMQQYGLVFTSPKVIVTEPVGYREMIAVLSNARFCLTDSGGLMEEAGVLGVPGLILRNETEHVRYIESGIHVLVGADREQIVRQGRVLVRNDREHGRRVAAAPDNSALSPADLIMSHMRDHVAGRREALP
jgi:UDP-N-acetylglucosamine 2-epimerase (non-hydrolysing)